MAKAIKVENLSKAYQIGEFSTGTLSRDIERWWALARGKEDPFLKIGETNVRSEKGESNVVWSLKDLNFEVEKGQAIGIIGKNGAGKSTLLKVLSQVTTPTTGTVKMKGRVASLLEVGTGFHPELTGRENIYLNGAILGMQKAEVKKKFDEIVDFSGVDRYIDTPVKRYSSGMYVRLAFAVAAHLDSEILIVDEVLAVGDAEFQKKCIGKMGDISKGEGRTILFVSHVLSMIRDLCKNTIVLKDGQIDYCANSNEAIEYYLETSETSELSGIFKKDQPSNLAIELTYAEVLNDKMESKANFEISESIFFLLKIECRRKIKGLYGYITISNSKGDLIIETDSNDLSHNKLQEIEIGENIFLLKLNPNILSTGKYQFYLNFSSSYSETNTLDSPKDILQFSVKDTITLRGEQRRSITSALMKWEKIDSQII